MDIPDLSEPLQGHRSNTGPYVVDGTPWDHYCPGLEATIKRLRLNGLRDDDDAMDIEEDSFEEQFAPLNTAFLTGKAVRSEINLKDLNEKDLSLFQAFNAKGMGVMAEVPSGRRAVRRRSQSSSW